MRTAPVKAIALQQCTDPTLSVNRTCLFSIRARVDAEGSAFFRLVVQFRVQSSKVQGQLRQTDSQLT